MLQALFSRRVVHFQCSRIAPRHPLSARYRSTKSQQDRIHDFAFAFDIDGVLLRSSEPVPGAAQALTFLQKHNIPFILLTNGGGKTEAQRISDISSKLSVPLSESLIVQSHTPFSELAGSNSTESSVSTGFYSNNNLSDKTVLVLGGDYDGCSNVAHTYGYKNVVTSADVYTAHPEIWPFSRNFQSYYSQFAKPLPRPINSASPGDSLKVDAVFVYNDPRDWGLDIQLLLDILLSREGILGTYSAKNGNQSLPNNGYLQDKQPPVYFSNPDLLWASSYHLSRLGQGGFREAFEGVWRAVTNNAELRLKTIGKPHTETYEFAERRLMQHRQELFEGQGGMHHQQGLKQHRLQRVYMIGDNPESDIAGANRYRSPIGVQWVSLLTRTGVFKDREGRPPTHKPKAIVDDVREAVRWAVRDSGWHDDHELLD